MRFHKKLITILGYNLWQEFTALQRQINHLFEEDFVLGPQLVWETASNLKIPAVELSQTDEAIYLKLAIPGIEAKDLDIQVTEQAVYVSGERKSKTKTAQKSLTRSEFHYGKYQRVIPLSARIQNTKVTAEYKDGILKLTLPKTEIEKNKVVKVNLEQQAAA